MFRFSLILLIVVALGMFIAPIFYTVSPDLCRMARLERGEVVELDFEIPGKTSSLLGSIYCGRVVDV